jgi:hypothetical protein
VKNKHNSKTFVPENNALENVRGLSEGFFCDRIKKTKKEGTNDE